MPSIETSVKVLSILGAVATFGWGVFQFTATQQQQSETRRIEATKPFLERQLALYTEVTQLASTIATTSDTKKKDKALDRFWSLYWGELALVEDAFVEGAMVKLGDALRNKASDDELKQLALDLAHACRNSLARSWGVEAWQSPHWWKPEPAASR